MEGTKEESLRFRISRLLGTPGEGGAVRGRFNLDSLVCKRGAKKGNAKAIRKTVV
jgi:hypothetical protein